MAFCQKCGSQLEDGAVFCSNCGNSVNASQPNGTTPPPYNHPYTAGPAANIVRTPVKTNYSLLAFIVLNLLTCGIYGYYIIYKLAQDVNQMCAEDGDKVGGLVAYILLSIVTCGIYNIYWLYKIQNRMHSAGPRYGVIISENGGTILLWYVLGLFVCAILQYVGYHIIFKTANKLGMAYNATYFR